MGEGFAVGGRYARYSSFVWSSKDTHVLLRPNPEHKQGNGNYDNNYCSTHEENQVSIAQMPTFNGQVSRNEAKLVVCVRREQNGDLFPMTFEKSEFREHAIAPTSILDRTFNGARTTPLDWKYKLWCGDVQNQVGDGAWNETATLPVCPTIDDEPMFATWGAKQVNELCEDFVGPEYRASHVSELPLFFSSSNLGSNYQHLTLTRGDSVMLNTKVYAQGNVFPTYIGLSGLLMIPGTEDLLEPSDIDVNLQPHYPETIWDDLEQNPSGDFSCTHKFAELQLLGRPYGQQIVRSPPGSGDDYLYPESGEYGLEGDIYFGNLDATLIQAPDYIEEVLYSDTITVEEADDICSETLGDGYRQATLSEYHHRVKSGWDLGFGLLTEGDNDDICRFHNVIVRDAIGAVIPVSDTQDYWLGDETDPLVDFSNGPVSIRDAHSVEVACGEFFKANNAGINPVNPDRLTYGSIACIRSNGSPNEDQSTDF